MKGSFMRNWILGLVAVGFLSGCTSLNTVSLTSIPAKRDQKVSAEASRVIFLGFNFDNDYVDQLTTDLKSQCPNGMISGILTKDEVIDYFLFIVWKHRVHAEGYCVKSAQTGQRAVPGRNRRPSDEETAEVLPQSKTRSSLSEDKI